MVGVRAAIVAPLMKGGQLVAELAVHSQTPRAWTAAEVSLVREVGDLARRAGASGKPLPTLTIDTQIGFRSAADRAAFADDLAAAVLDLAARYHHDDGRPHRLVVAAHPLSEENL